MANLKGENDEVYQFDRRYDIKDIKESENEKIHEQSLSSEGDLASFGMKQLSSIDEEDDYSER